MDPHDYSHIHGRVKVHLIVTTKVNIVSQSSTS
jgi:hypothetical protein